MFRGGSSLNKKKENTKRHMRHFIWSITTCPASRSTRRPLRQGYSGGVMAEEGTG